MKQAVENDAARYLGTATTRDKFALKVLGTRCIPALLEEPKEHCVHGEVYDMTDSVLDAMEFLDGVTVGFYYRVYRGVGMDDAEKGSERMIECCVTLKLDHKVTLGKNSNYKEYTRELHESYV